jgi:hypothetical protein
VQVGENAGGRLLREEVPCRHGEAEERGDGEKKYGGGQKHGKPFREL